MNLLAEWRSKKRRARLPHERQTGALAAIMRTRTVFVHIPKCGGKSVIKTVYGLQTHDWFGHASIDFYRSLLGPSRFQRFLKFSVMRAPVARTRSAFYFAQGGGFDLPEDRLLVSELAGLTFEDFVLQGHLENLMSRFIIFRPQHSFICDAAGQLQIDALCRLETLPQNLQRVLGADVQIDQVVRENMSDYNRDETVDPAVRAKVLDLYARDATLYDAIEA
jgi:hypothetical protein